MLATAVALIAGEGFTAVVGSTNSSPHPASHMPAASAAASFPLRLIRMDAPFSLSSDEARCH
jgi:hypothetical protein